MPTVVNWQGNTWVPVRKGSEIDLFKKKKSQKAQLEKKKANIYKIRNEMEDTIVDAKEIKRMLRKALAILATNQREGVISL